MSFRTNSITGINVYCFVTKDEGHGRAPEITYPTYPPGHLIGKIFLVWCSDIKLYINCEENICSKKNHIVSFVCRSPDVPYSISACGPRFLNEIL